MPAPLNELRSILSDSAGRRVGTVTGLLNGIATVSCVSGTLKTLSVPGLRRGSRVILDSNNTITGRAPSPEEIPVYVV